MNKPTRVHFAEAGTSLCQERRWHSIVGEPKQVTCKRCLHLMKTPIARIRAARENYGKGERCPQ